MVCRTFCRC